MNIDNLDCWLSFALFGYKKYPIVVTASTVNRWAGCVVLYKILERKTLRLQIKTKQEQIVITTINWLFNVAKKKKKKNAILLNMFYAIIDAHSLIN